MSLSPEPEFARQIELARGGDAAALGSLLDQHRGYLRFLARQQVRGRLEARVDASDVAQQTILLAVAGVGQFQGQRPGEFVAWLRAIQERLVKNLLRDHVVAQKRSLSRETATSDTQLGCAPQAVLNNTPSQHMMRQEAAVRLALALNSLPEDQAEALRLRYFEKKSIDEIAALMERSKQSIAGLLKRGLVALRETIGLDESGAADV